MNVGIDLINFYVPKHYLSLETLAQARGVDANKFTVGLGQEKMAIVAPHEDIVTMAVEAAYDIVQSHEEEIDLLLFATESAIDYSKSAGNYVHRLLNLPTHVRSLELKQACYAATGALQLAISHVTLHPDKKVLVIASDIAWYGFQTPGESTQGAGAVAMLISQNPRLAVVSPGVFATEELPDFYRPSYHDVPIVDGRLSIRCYLDLLRKVAPNRAYPYICYHLPFANMANKANSALPYPVSEQPLEVSKQVGKVVGNIYNGSLFLSLLSVLMYANEPLGGTEIGMFSYGSGAICEFFTVTLQPTYLSAYPSQRMHACLDDRISLSIEQYEAFMNQYHEREHGLHYQPTTEFLTKERFYLKNMVNGHRFYETI